jgi:hypothetical protein
MAMRTERLAQLRWTADLVMESLDLQASRIAAGSPAPRHDLDFYLLSLFRLREIGRIAGTLDHADAAAVGDAIEERFPLVREVRNWWSHPAKEIGFTSWFSDAIYRLEPNGRAVAILDVDDHHSEVRAFYVRLCDALGLLPAQYATRLRRSEGRS